MNCANCKAALPDGARFCNSCGNAAAGTEPHSDPHIGGEPAMIGREIVGRYRILAKLGEGGMGTVYRAEQISLKRTVALKLLRPELSANPMLLARFNAEAAAVGKLSHPNTVAIYDFGQDTDGSLFIAMELIEGRSLRTVVASEAPLLPGRALAIAGQVAASLTDAHAHAIIHRDLKPDNVMLQDRGRQRDVARVLDFGIAKLRDETHATQQALTQAGDVLGTPQYMAPEQIRGEHIDGRTDIYALGCMIYEMVTGRLPFEGTTIMAIMSKHLLEQVVPPSVRRPDLRMPAAIDQLVMTAMAKDAAARWPTMEQFGEHMASVLASLPPEARPTTPKLSAPVSAAMPLQTPQPVMTPPAYSMTPQHGQVAPQALASAPTPPPGYVAPGYPPPHPTPVVKGHGGLVIGLSLAAVFAIGLIAWGASGGGSKKPDSPAVDPKIEPKNDPKTDPQEDPFADSKGQPELPSGAHLIPPEGWTQTASNAMGQEIASSRFPGAQAMMAVMPPGVDENSFIDVAKKGGSQFQQRMQVMSAGAARDALLFQKNLNGTVVAQVVVFYPSRVFVFAQIPATLFSQPGFQDEATRFWANNVVVP
ncbi:MAG TPA: protein kinase [Kofleriaceae bacterium]|nr:protein kinase [Kofleriaceae bacterium]